MKRKFWSYFVCAVFAATLMSVALTACGNGSTMKILTPANGAENVSTCPEISWSAEENATGYHVEIASDGGYENVVREATTAELSYTVGNALAHATQYHLRVTAFKEGENETVALNTAVSSFKTIASHDTDAPDYTAARTLYDFESFADDAALRAEFPTHVDGNELGVSLVEGGVNNSKAMQIDYTAGNKGWAGVTCKLPSDKKVWSGAKGIRMWVKGDGMGVNVEVRIGKRGYQSWAATFSVKNPEACYVSIPFSAFEDIGGGDGIWDLAGITRFWLFFTGSSDSTLLIDDVSIGSDENYTTDSRSEIETTTPAPSGVYDDFNGYADDDEMEQKWSFENMGNYTLAGSPYSDGAALELTPSAAWATARLSFPYYDFTQIVSVSFRASAGNYVIQLETAEGGVFEKENIIVAKDGDEAGINLSELILRTGSEGTLASIRCLVIGCKDANEKVRVIDDLTFSVEIFVPKDYTPQTGVEDDFNDYADLTALEEVWKKDGTIAFDLVNSPFGEGGKALKLTSSSAWGVAKLSYPNVSFAGITSIRFKATAGSYQFRLIGSDNVSYTADITIAKDGDWAGANLEELTPNSGNEVRLTSIKELWIGVKQSAPVTIDDLIFSDETFVPKDYTPKVGAFDNFEDYASDAELQAVWKGDGATLALETQNPLSGTKSLKISQSGWVAFTYDYPNVSFHNVRSIRFKATAGTYSVRLVGTNWAVYKKNVVVAVTGDEVGVNIADLATDNGDKLTGTIKQFYIGFTAGAGGALFDDFAYSDEEYQEPDRTAGLIENFEELTDDTISSFCAVEGATLALETEDPLSGTKSAKFTANGTFDFTVNSAYLKKYDFTKTIGFSFAVRLRSSAGNPSIVIQIGSYSNVYTITRPVYSSSKNNIGKIVVMYDAMSLSNGNSGALMKEKIDYLRVFVNQYDQNFTAVIDDLQFFTEENATPDPIVIDDFSSYQDSAALQSAWHSTDVTLEGGAMKLTTASGWNGLQYNFAAAGGIGSEDDFQNCYAISFDVTAGADVDLIVKLQRWSNAKETTVSVKGGETTHVVVYFSQLSGENDWSDMIFNYLTIGLTYYGVTDITFDNVVFLRG